MSESDRLQQIAGEYFDQLHQAMPILATELGLHTYDHLLGDFTAQGLSSLPTLARAYGQRLGSLDPAKLSLAEQTDLALTQMHAASMIREMEKIARWRYDPNMYVEWPLVAIFLLIVREFAPLDVRMKSVLERLKQVPDVLAAGRANVQNVPPVYVQIAIETATGGIQFYQQLIPYMAAQVPSLQQDLMAASAKATAAVNDYLTWLKETLAPQATGGFAVGPALFAEILRQDHLLDLTPAQLAAWGQEVFRATREEMERLASEIAPGKTWPEVVQDARNRYPSGEQLLPAYAAELEKLKAHIRQHDLVTIPANERLDVTETPVFERGMMPYAAYMFPAPFEEQQKGHFWVTPLNAAASPDAQVAQLREHCYANLPIIALHEAYPGHHLQLVFSNNVSSPIRRNAGMSSLFAEGWALYCEQLMGETGYYSPEMKLFQLKNQLWRAARIIVDVGLHCQGMTVDAAANFLAEEVKLSPAAALAEVHRYTQSPTQPSTYLLGKREVLRLRDKAAGIPLRRFHDALLSSGTIPFKLVEPELWARLKA